MSGSSPNCAAMSMGSSTCVTILVGNGTFGGTTALNPNGKPNETGRMALRSSRLIPSRSASQVPRVRYSWVSWPPMETAGTIGTPASIAVRTYPLRPLKSMTFSDAVGR